MIAMMFWDALLGFAITLYDCVIIYILCQIGMYISIAVAPIFIPLILFQRTKELFDSWLKLCIRFALHPALLFTGLIIIINLIEIAYFNVFGGQLCIRCFIELDIPIPGLNGFSYPLFCIPGLLPDGFEANNMGFTSTVYTLFVNLIILYFFLKIARSYVQFSNILANSLLGTQLNFQSSAKDLKSLYSFTKGVAKIVTGYDGAKAAAKEESKTRARRSTGTT